jgi:hypothetical protein
MPYQVWVDDNYHIGDESERYELGEFASYDEALHAAKRIVDESLSSGYQPGMTAEQLYNGYSGFGEDSFIVAVAPSRKVKPEFSAWEYAKARCKEICK